MAHATHVRRSSGFSAFFLGVLFTLLAAGAAIYWLGVREPLQAVQIEDVGIPVPDLVPPGTIPEASQPAQ